MLFTVRGAEKIGLQKAAVRSGPDRFGEIALE